MGIENIEYFGGNFIWGSPCSCSPGRNRVESCELQELRVGFPGWNCSYIQTYLWHLQSWIFLKFSSFFMCGDVIGGFVTTRLDSASFGLKCRSRIFVLLKQRVLDHLIFAYNATWWCRGPHVTNERKPWHVGGDGGQCNVSLVPPS